MAGRPPSKDAPEFGQRLAALRLAQGFTQPELAERIGVTRKMIDYYERRAVNIKSDIIKKLASVLNVTADELLGLQPVKVKPGRKSKLQEQFERIESLPKSEQDFISQTLERLVSQAEQQQKAS